MGRIGAHVSTAGGVANSIERAAALGCESFQIFSRNQRQWSPPPLDDNDVTLFRERLASSSMGPVLVHGSYLINPASAAPLVRERSVTALADELSRCSQLGLEDLVIHPGSHGGSGVAAGIERAVSTVDGSLDILEDEHPVGGSEPMILLETTAGQGNGIGGVLEHLVDIIEGSSHPESLGICLDTCHMHAAGYDLTGKDSYDEVMDRVLSLFGERKVRGIHLNDSRKGLGSRIDRHANIGEGTMGLEPFRLLVNDPRFEATPMVLETPGGEGMYRRDLKLLRTLRESRGGSRTS